MRNMPRPTRLPSLGALLALLLLSACGESPTTPARTLTPDATVSQAAAGNSMNAKSCQKNGWQGLVTSTGAPFAAETACTSYAAKGGVLYQKQTITFAALAGKTYGDADFGVSATASSGLAVTFTASGACTVSGATVHLTGAGSCTITAQQAGNAMWIAAADVAQTFAIAQGSQSISFTSAIPSPANVGTTYTPTAAATSGLSVAFTLDATSIGCALASGVVSFTSAGTCVVNANQAGDANYGAAAQVQQSITTQVPCISDDASLRAAAAAGGSYDFCAQGTTVLLTGGQVVVGTTLRLSAVGTGNAVINGQAASRIFTVASTGNLTLNNVTVTNGRETTSGRGGGIHVNRGVLVLNGNTAVTGNTAPFGAGIFIDPSGSHVTLNDAATVSNNVSAQLGTNWGVDAGGVYVDNYSTFIMNGASTVSGNSVSGPGSGGGGLLVNAATVQMNGSSGITGNQANGGLLGGGIYFVNGGSLTLSGSAHITGNIASNGGGILRWDNGAGTITGVTAANVTGNTPNNCASGSVQTPAVPGCVP
jgi:large repetitive protein